MTVCNTSKCPNCGGELKHYDSVNRVIKTKGGNKSYIKVRRLKCTICKKIHRNVPSYLIPYKHYDVDIISGVIEGYITPDTIGYEDYPCEMTMIRWKNAEFTTSFMRK